MKKIILFLLPFTFSTGYLNSKKIQAQPMLPMAINTAKNLAGAAAIIGTGAKVKRRINQINAQKTRTLSTTTTTTKK